MFSLSLSLFSVLSPSSFWPTLTSRLVFDRALFFGLQAGQAERRFAPDRTEHDLEDPDLGAAAMDDNTEPGGGQAGGEAGGSGHGVTFDDWPDDDEAEVVPRRQPASGRGAGSSAAPPGRGGGEKRRAAQGLFGSRTKKPRGGAAATRREEAAAKAARFRKAVKKPQTVSA